MFHAFSAVGRLVEFPSSVVVKEVVKALTALSTQQQISVEFVIS